MQTFLPYPDFAESAAVLDTKRLGKQRVEALQVLRAVTRVTYGWKRHPAVRMWVGFAEGVGAYGTVMCQEWVARGGADTVAGTIGIDLAAAGLPSVPRTQQELARACGLPEWIGDERVHASHRAALVRKDPEFYGELFPDADPELPYLWPGAPTAS
jgi:Pyrimidine dimer DNA glycosylase